MKARSFLSMLQGKPRSRQKEAKQERPTPPTAEASAEEAVISQGPPLFPQLNYSSPSKRLLNGETLAINETGSHVSVTGNKGYLINRRVFGRQGL